MKSFERKAPKKGGRVNFFICLSRKYCVLPEMNKIKQKQHKKMEKIKGTELITRTKVKNSPFIIINDTETKIYFGVIGNYKITNNYNSEEEVKKDLNKITWNRIITIIAIMQDLQNMQNNKEP